MTATATDLPRWDLTPFFPGPDSPELRAALDRVKELITELDQFCQAHEIRGRKLAGVDAAVVTTFKELITELDQFCEAHEIRGRKLAGVDGAVVTTFEGLISRLNRVYDEYALVRSYLGAHVTTDANDDLSQSLMAELRTAEVPLNQVSTRYTAWFGSLDLDALLAASETARGYEFMLRKAQVYARHQMSEAEENLAAELQPAGLSGWVRLHGTVSALLEVPVALPEGEQTLPMSRVRALANDPDREVRRAAYEAELRGWESVSVSMAAALNGVKGYQSVTHRRRGWADDLEPTLLQNSIDRATLEAMHQACVESFPDFRRYMHAKARALGVERLAWYDVSAPVGSGSRSFSWEEGAALVSEQFAVYSSRMAEFADRTFRERWTDAEPRPGKEGGAYCTRVVPGVSRVMMNYDGSFNSVSTLAHELGHAYHNLNLKDRANLQGRTPSTLAETASIFCETLLFEAALAQATEEERLVLVETSLQRDLMVVVDIHSRFLFEQSVFERRAKRDLTVREFNELMLDAQRQTYGDGLDPELLHPYMWAVKGHYYGPTFYNYPYTFGLLFGLGLYARYRQSPEGFHAGYDDLLSSTGMADAPTLAERFGIDVRNPDFWRSSLDIIRNSIAEFERLTA